MGLVNTQRIFKAHGLDKVTEGVNVGRKEREPKTESNPSIRTYGHRGT